MEELDLQIPVETEEQPEKIQPSRKKQSDRKLSFQLSQIAVCLVALTFLFAIKLLGGNIYNYSKAVFEKEFDTPINVDQVLDSVTAQQIVSSQHEKYGVGGETDSPDVPYYENYEQASESISNISNVNSMQLPLENGTVTSEFGYRIHPLSNKNSFHKGIDIGADYGENICAALSGTVEKAVKNDVDYGNFVVLRHSDGLQTMYAHCSKLKVSVGDDVQKGDVIGLVGSTGKSTGPHLHFEIRVNNVRLNPAWYLDF